ncbi:MAG: hypothetical protein LBQ52_10010 [Helicobacteraceae bacterium]|jgi:hypothetical protein|nr:hypothetical protein [Helicobacteraceae bacterium]
MKKTLWFFIPIVTFFMLSCSKTYIVFDQDVSEEQTAKVILVDTLSGGWLTVTDYNGKEVSWSSTLEGSGASIKAGKTMLVLKIGDPSNPDLYSPDSYSIENLGLNYEYEKGKLYFIVFSVTDKVARISVQNEKREELESFSWGAGSFRRK